VKCQVTLITRKSLNVTLEQVSWYVLIWIRKNKRQNTNGQILFSSKRLQAWLHDEIQSVFFLGQLVDNQLSINRDITVILLNGPHSSGAVGSRRAQGCNEGGKGGTIFRAPIHYGGAELLLEAPESPNNVTSTFFNTVNLPSKDFRFDHRGAKLRPLGRRFDQRGAEFVFWPGRHITSLRPWSCGINR